MSILTKNKAPSIPGFIPAFNVDTARQRITRIRQRITGFQGERSSLQASSPDDWPPDTSRSRVRELDELQADGERLIVELSAQVTAEEERQAARRKGVEPQLALVEAEIDAELMALQKLLDQYLALVDAHNAAGGHGVYSARHGQMTQDLAVLGANTNRFTVGMGDDWVKRLVRLPVERK